MPTVKTVAIGSAMMILTVGMYNVEIINTSFDQATVV
jgi:hypothetical protein